MSNTNGKKPDLFFGLQVTRKGKAGFFKGMQMFEFDVVLQDDKQQHQHTVKAGSEVLAAIQMIRKTNHSRWQIPCVDAHGNPTGGISSRNEFRSIDLPMRSEEECEFTAPEF